jgi:hypothetical protein
MIAAAWRPRATPGNDVSIAMAETERAAPTLEVRFLWGGDLLRAVHLTPPRSFFIGGDARCDLVVDEEALGARRFAIVDVQRRRVAVMPPTGATGTILGANGEHGSVEGATIPLGHGTKVSLALPARRPGTAYREARGGAGQHIAAPVVLEIALVKAGAAVGRTGWLGDRRRLLQSVALVTAAAFACMALASTQPTAAVDDDDAAKTNSLQLAFAHAKDALAKRDAEAKEPNPPEPSPLLLALEQATPEPRWSDFIAKVSQEDGCALAAVFMGASCARFASDQPLDAREGYEEVLVDLDFGSGARALSRAAAPWERQAEAEYLERPVLAGARVQLREPEIKGSLPPAAVRRVVRDSFGRFRTCYRRELHQYPTNRGLLHVKFVVDREGSVSLVRTEGSPTSADGRPSNDPQDRGQLPDIMVSRCIRDAFRGMRFPAPPEGVATVAQPILLHPGRELLNRAR